MAERERARIEDHAATKGVGPREEQVARAILDQRARVINDAGERRGAGSIHRQGVAIVVHIAAHGQTAGTGGNNRAAARQKDGSRGRTRG